MQGGVKASLACASGVPTVVGMDGPWRIEYYVDEHGRDPFRRWVDGLPPSAARAVIDEIELRLALDGPNVCRDHWGRSLGLGLYEFRIRKHEILVRVFFGTARRRVVIILAGLDKGRRPKHQRAAIEEARRRLANHRHRHNTV